MNQLARFEPKTMPTPPSTTPDMDATNCATETSPKKDVQVYIYISELSRIEMQKMREAWQIPMSSP